MFGFLPVKEVKAAGVGNLGLQDRELSTRKVRRVLTFLTEREALRWVQNSQKLVQAGKTVNALFVTGK